MKKAKFSLLVLSLMLVSVGTMAVAQGTPAPLSIVPNPAPGGLVVNLWTERSSYMAGETVQIYYSLNRAAYIYLYDVRPDGLVRLIFPNAYSRNNFACAGTHRLPDNAAYNLLVSPPMGIERLQILASPIPLPLAPNAFRDPFPTIAPGPTTAMRVINQDIMRVAPYQCRASAWTSFTIRTSYVGYPSASSHPFCPPMWCRPETSWGTEFSSSGLCLGMGTNGRWRFSFRIRIGENH